MLWTLFLNLAFGMAAHQAMHHHGGPPSVPAVQALTAWAAPAVDEAADASQPTPAEAPGQATGDLCLGCHALSLLAAAAPPPTPDALLPVAATQAPPSAPTAAALPRPSRWRFASRDPPAAA